MTDCNVCIDQDGGENAEFWAVKVLVGRHAYRCYECGDEIHASVPHQKITMKYDGTWTSVRTCLACVEIHRALSCNGYRCTGSLWEDLQEYVFPTMTRACIEKCQTVAAKQKLTDRWNAWRFHAGNLACPPPFEPMS